MTKNNFSLSLGVEIKDHFSKTSQRIKKETKELDKSFAKTQKQVADVRAYSKASRELERLSASTNHSTKEIRAQETELKRLSTNLQKAGINTKDLISSEKKLENQLQKTNSQLRKRKNLSKAKDIGTTGAAEMVATGVGVGTFISKGVAYNSNERLAAAATAKELSFFQSRDQRLWRNSSITKTGASQKEILDTQVLAMQLGFEKDKKNKEATMTSLGLQNIFPDWDTREIMEAMRSLTKNFNLSISDASNLIYKTRTKAGDSSGDLLDTFREYSQNLAANGLSANDFTASLISGKQAGAYNYDKIADGLKESIRARLTDKDVFSSLVGTGDKAGEIDTLIQDQKIANELKTRLGKYRHDVESGKNSSQSFKDVLSYTSSLYESTPRAARNIMERVAGVQFAEDLGQDVVKAIASGLQNSDEIVGENKKDMQKAFKDVFSPLQKSTNALKANFDSLFLAISNTENSLAPAINKANSLGGDSASFLNENHLAAMGVLLGGGYLARKGAKKAISSIFSKNKPTSSKTSSFNKMGKLGGKIFKPLGAIFGAKDISSKLVAGDTLGAKKTGAKMGGSIAGTAIGQVAIPIPGVGAIVGGIAGDYIGSKLADNFIKEQDPKTSQKEKSTLASPQIILNFSPTININSKDDENVQDSIIKALNEAKPDLINSLKNVLEELTIDERYILS